MEVKIAPIVPKVIAFEIKVNLTSQEMAILRDEIDRMHTHILEPYVKLLLYRIAERT